MSKGLRLQERLQSVITDNDKRTQKMRENWNNDIFNLQNQISALIEENQVTKTDYENYSTNTFG